VEVGLSFHGFTYGRCLSAATASAAAAAARATAASAASRSAAEMLFSGESGTEMKEESTLGVAGIASYALRV
jgi:hypothetical protein